MISQETQSTTVSVTARHKSGATRRHELNAGQGVFVGTSDNCGLQLDGAGLSEIHCRLEYNDGELRVQDWMSDQGTRLNGQPVDGNQKVGASDVIQIGDHEITIGSGESVTKAAAEETTEQEAAEETWEEPQEEQSTQASQHAEPGEDFQAVDSALQDEPLPVESSPIDSSADDDSLSIDFAADFFDVEEEETYDRETVALLQAEIEDLQAQLAQRDAEASHEPLQLDIPDHEPEESDQVLDRMQELIEEANRSDERVAILEEMLLAAEDASRSEVEERNQLEAWVGDIERRIGQREEEHAAELNALRQRLEESADAQARLQRQLRQAAAGGNAPKHYEETLDQLQQSNRELQEKLAESEKECRQLQQRTENQSEEIEGSLRAERAAIAKERAKISRMRFELSNQLKEIDEIDEIPKNENQADKETAHRIQTLRQHLREIHEQEKQEERDAPLTARLKKLWKRVEY